MKSLKVFNYSKRRQLKGKKQSKEQRRHVENKQQDDMLKSDHISNHIKRLNTSVKSQILRNLLIFLLTHTSWLVGFQFPNQGCGSVSKESACNVRDLDLIPWLGRSHGEGKDYPFQYSGLENSMDWYSPWGCKESDTTERLSLHFTLCVKQIAGGSDWYSVM